MRRPAVAFLSLACVLAFAANAEARATVAILHFSDYHSHALTFYSEGREEQGGIARAIGRLRAEHRRGALVFSGGDMMNHGAPAWSDKYQCAEWPWLNGVVDAMAFGNHDADYGAEALARCRAGVRYPILSANTAGFRPYAVFVREGVRVGVFAVAGADFPKLVTGLVFTNPVDAAREAVRALREVEHVDAVVMIGHEHRDDDFALAAAVPGIDLILGTHSHLKEELRQIPGTSTWFISPYQYLTYLSRVELTIEDHRVVVARGGLVPVDASMKADRTIARRVAAMQRDLERDPQYAALFAPIGTLSHPLSVDDLGALTVEAMRAAAGADVALSTVSSFRQPLPSGTLTMELLRAALPYDNEIVACSMTGAELQRLLDAVEARRGTDSFAYIARPESIDPARSYRVAAADYFARVAYKEAFACRAEGTGSRVREEIRKRLSR